MLYSSSIMPANEPLLYLTALSYPSRKATNIQVAANAREFQRLLGSRFTLVISEDGQGELKDVNIQTNGLGRLIPWHLSSLGAFFWLPYWIHKKSPGQAYLYFKDFNLATIAVFWNSLFFKNSYKICVEIHHFDNTWMERYVLNHAHLAVCITSHLFNLIQKKLPRPTRQTIIAPDGADPDMFRVEQSKGQLRQELGLPLNATLIGYTGTFQTMSYSKGIETAVESLKYLDAKFILIVVGGEPAEIEKQKNLIASLDLAQRVIFVGRAPHSQIPHYLAACDFLVAPYPNNIFNALYTSPLKLFEYMAAQRPIIISDLPSIRDILDESNAYLCPANKPEAFAQAIEQASSQPQEALLKSKRAYELLIQKYTWKARAQRILETLNQKI